MADSVAELISKALRIPPDVVSDSLAYQDIPQWDSMGHLDMVVALEKRLGVSISDELVPRLTTVRAIRDFVGDRLGK